MLGCRIGTHLAFTNTVDLPEDYFTLHSLTNSKELLLLHRLATLDIFWYIFTPFSG